jgi:hypothetical protein
VTDRLTRTELAWLFAQEARSAAQKLRQGIGGPPTDIPPPPDEGTGGVEHTLDRLDEAVSMLATLHGHAMPRGRRGKVDVAALLWEIAPEARVQIEMGEGTTVFGDESELRRMLLVLVGQSADPSSARGTSEVTVRRQGDEVHVGVNLGPDQPSTFETERAWLARMATRYGGRLELDGSMHTLVLPADVDQTQREIALLRRELAAAQAQGEAYARELAAARGADGSSSVPPARVAYASARPAVADGLAALAAAARSLSAELRGILSSIGRDIAPLRDRAGDAGEIAGSVGRHVTAASEIVSDLARLGACPVGELPRHVDVADLARDVVREFAVRAARHDVRVVVDAPEDAYEVVPPGAVAALVHSLVDNAVTATPPGGTVTLTLAVSNGELVLTVDDGGPPLPAAARAGFLSRDYEILAGRPPRFALIAAHAIATHARAPLELEDAPAGGARARVVLTRS